MDDRSDIYHIKKKMIAGVWRREHLTVGIVFGRLPVTAGFGYIARVLGGRGSIFTGWHALVRQIQDFGLSKRGDLVIRRESL